MRNIKKVIIEASLVPDPAAYEGKSNADLAKEILQELQDVAIPYVEQIQLVRVVDESPSLGVKKFKN